MKKLLLTVLVSFCSSVAYSQDILGSYITYKALDSVTYEVTVTIFRDCSITGASPINDSLEVSWGTGISQQFKSKLNFIDTTNAVVIGKNCTVSGNICIKHYEYRDTVSINNVNACEIKFAWYGNTRSSNLTTGMAGQTHYNFALVNKCYSINNNSARLTPDIAFILPVGQDINGGLTNTDSDSLGYSIVSPLASASANVTYSGGWTYDKPVSFLGFPNKNIPLAGGFHFDNLFGIFMFRPTVNSQQTVYCMEVIEWRVVNGVITKVGIVRYDLSWMVIASSGNRKPLITSNLPVNMLLCENDSLKLNISTSDQDFNDTVTISWKTTIPGAVITPDTAKKHPDISLAWLPQRQHVSNTPYSLTITAQDNACPYPAIRAQKFNITVLKYPEASDFNVIKTAKCNSAKIKINLLNNLPLIKFTLMDEDSILTAQGDSAELLFKGSGWKKFYINAVNGPACSATFTDSVFISSDYILNLSTKNDTAVCSKDSVFMFTNPLNGQGPYRYFWKGMKADSNKAQPFYKESITSPRIYRVYVSDSNRCAGHHSSVITMYDLPVTNLTVPIVACKNDTVYLNGNTISGLPPFHYAWAGLDTVMNIPIKMEETTVFKFRAIDANKCIYYDSAKVTVYPIDFIPLQDTTICRGDTVKLKPLVKALPPVNIEWLNTGTFDDSLMVAPFKDSVFVARLSDGLACTMYDTIEFIVNTVIIDAPDDYSCRGDIYTLKPQITAVKPYTITWNGMQGGDSLTFTADSTRQFVLHISDKYNCQSTDTVTVFNWPSPQALAGPDRNVCHDVLQHVRVLPVLGTPPYNILWNNGLTVDSFATYYTSSTLLTVKVTDSNGCEAFDTINIQVKPQSQATITPLPPVCETEPDRLLVAFPMGGTWTGPGVSNARFYPPAAGPGKHPLVYTFISPYGCAEKDTMIMIVKQAPIPGFYADKTVALQGTTINFTNVTLADTTYTSKWEMGEPSAPGNIITTKNAAYTYNSLGKYTVRLTVNNGLCAPVTAEKNNYIFITDTIVGISSTNSSPFKIYPNPAVDELFIEGESIESVEIYDLQGRKVNSLCMQAIPGAICNVAGLPPGIYYLEIKSGENIYRQKMVKVAE